MMYTDADTVFESRLHGDIEIGDDRHRQRGQSRPRRYTASW